MEWALGDAPAWHTPNSSGRGNEASVDLCMERWVDRWGAVRALLRCQGQGSNVDIQKTGIRQVPTVLEQWFVCQLSLILVLLNQSYLSKLRTWKISLKSQLCRRLTLFYQRKMNSAFCYSCNKILIDLKLMSGDLLERVNCSDQAVGVINLFLINKKYTVLISNHKIML